MYGVELSRYLEKMLYLRYIAGLIKGDMEYTGAPLPEVFAGIAERIREPYAAWLKGTALELEMREESGFARIWNRCIDRHLKELGLKSEHSILLKELGTFLGQADRETFLHSMQIYLNKMDLEIEKLREGLASRKKIGGCLGVMSGLFLVVVLL